MFKSKGLAVAAVLALATSVHAGLIDFEDAEKYGGDEAVISDQYAAEYGVTFQLFAGKKREDAALSAATYELRGGNDPSSGFVRGNDGRGYDVERNSAAGQLGNYFMTGSTSINKTGYVRLEIDYAQAVNGASGELWDIDGGGAKKSEQYVVTAFDSLGNKVATVESPEGLSYGSNSLDGLPWTWSLGGKDITKIEIEFTGTKTSGVGLAFNNFNHNSENPNADSVAAPLPAAVWIALVGLIGLVPARFRRR